MVTVGSDGTLSNVHSFDIDSSWGQARALPIDHGRVAVVAAGHVHIVTVVSRGRGDLTPSGMWRPADPLRKA